MGMSRHAGVGPLPFPSSTGAASSRLHRLGARTLPRKVRIDELRKNAPGRNVNGMERGLSGTRSTSALNVNQTPHKKNGPAGYSPYEAVQCCGGSHIANRETSAASR